MTTNTEILLQKLYNIYRDLSPFPRDYVEWRAWYISLLPEEDSNHD